MLAIVDGVPRRALLGEVDDTASAGSGHGRGGGRPTARAGGGAAGRGRGGSLNTSRPASPDSTSSGRSAGARGWSPGEAQQQLQAQRLDDNQAEIERRDEEIANIEQTVDGTLTHTRTGTHARAHRRA